MQGNLVDKSKLLETHELDFIIEARPQITVFPDADGNVHLTSKYFHEQTDSIEHDAVVIPRECIAQIAAALQRIADAK